MGLLMGFFSPILGPLMLLLSPLYMLDGAWETVREWIEFFS